jgi:hypothetical protein
MSTDEKYRRVCELAGAAVLESTRNGAHWAYVRRELLNRIEDALIAAGFDMQAARTKLATAKKAERKASRIKRDAKELAKYPVGTQVKLFKWSALTPDWVTPFDTGQVIEPEGRKRKPDHVYVRWNVEDKPRSWVSVYDIE